MRVTNPQNAIIIEGVWGLGKTELSQVYCTKHKYTLLPEPFHTHDGSPESIADVNAWYLEAHKAREESLEFPSVLLERSILSSFAFLYALKQPLPDSSYIYSLKESIQKNKVLLVYLRADKKLVPHNKEDLEKYSINIQNLLLNEEARIRYDEWYVKILPREYGITPFVLEVSNNGVRRSKIELVNEIHLSLVCNRIAQVNVVCFTHSVFPEGIAVLVLKRNKKKGGFWQTVTGGVHLGEDLSAAVQREIHEEIGISPDRTDTFWTPCKYSFLGDDGYFLTEYVFGCEVKDSTEIRIGEEHQELEWLNVQEAKGRVLYENNKLAIEAVYKETEHSR